MIQAPVGVFTPDNVAHAVTMVQKPLFKDFFMQSGAIEAHIQGTLNISHQLPIIRCGINAVGIEALIQDQPLEHGLFVD